jgi:hypothetical protein
MKLIKLPIYYEKTTLVLKRVHEMQVRMIDHDIDLPYKMQKLLTDKRSTCGT